MKVPVYQRKQTMRGTSVAERPMMPMGKSPVLEAWGEVGRTIDRSVDLLTHRLYQKKQQQDAIAVSRWMYGEGGFADQATVLTQSILALKEEQADGATERYSQDFEKLREKSLSQIEDEDQRRKAETLLLPYRQARITQVAAHEAREFQNAINAGVDRATIGAIKRVADNPADVQSTIKEFEAIVSDLRPGQNNTKLVFDVENKIKKVAETANEQAILNAVWDQAMQMPKNEGEKFIKDSLPFDSEGKVLKRYRTEKDVEEKRKDEARKEEVKAINEDFTKRIDTLTTTEVERSALDPVGGAGTKMWWIEKIESRAKGKTDPFKEYDPKALSGVKRKVNTQPDKVDLLTDIWGPVGKGKDGGITSDQAQQAQNTLNTRLKNTPQAKRLGQAEDYLKRLRTKYAWSEEPLENEESYYKWQDAINQYAEKNPDDDVLAWVQEQLKPDEQNFIERLLNIATLGLAFEPELKEPPAKKEKRFKIKKTIVQTGQTPDGRKVVKYSDGSIEYAD